MIECNNYFYSNDNNIAVINFIVKLEVGSKAIIINIIFSENYITVYLNSINSIFANSWEG
jgi:hypothetical protein